jgi:hypothetical protein
LSSTAGVGRLEIGSGKAPAGGDRSNATGGFTGLDIVEAVVRQECPGPVFEKVSRNRLLDRDELNLVSALADLVVADLLRSGRSRPS